MVENCCSLSFCLSAFSNCFILVSVTSDPQPNPCTLGMKQEYTNPSQSTTHICMQTQGQYIVAYWHVFERWEETIENSNATQMDTRSTRTESSTQTVNRAEDRTWRLGAIKQQYHPLCYTLRVFKHCQTYLHLQKQANVINTVYTCSTMTSSKD